MKEEEFMEEEEEPWFLYTPPFKKHCGGTEVKKNDNAEAANVIGFQCKICSLKFTFKHNLKRHLQNVHGNLENNVKRHWCCSECDNKFYQAFHLKEHQKIAHGQPVNSKKIFFETYEDFLKWKAEIEEKTFSFFPKSNNYTSTNIFERYSCQFHGNQRNHGPPPKGIRKKKKTCKKNESCLASITVKQKNIGFEVIYTDTHNHDLNIKNTIYQPVPHQNREEIENLLTLGVPSFQVYNKLTQKFNRANRDSATFSKKDLIKLQDVRNIEQKVKKSQRLDKDEIKSLTSIIKLWDSEEYSPVILFSSYFSDLKIGPQEALLNPGTEFIFGLQTLQQVERMEDAMDAMLFIDTTHGLYEDYQLLNIIALDKNRHGYPVAFYVISDGTEETLTICFKSLKARNPSFKPQVIMTDDCRALYNALRNVYGKEVKLILCNWHIWKSWLRKVNSLIKNEGLKEDILCCLKKILKEIDYTAVKNLILEFNSRFRKNTELINYLKTYYFGEQRMARWSISSWNFPHCESDRNMFVESFHNVLKGKFFLRKGKRRLDDLVNVLSLVEEDYYRNFILNDLSDKAKESLPHSKDNEERNLLLKEVASAEDEELFVIKDSDDIVKKTLTPSKELKSRDSPAKEIVSIENEGSFINNFGDKNNGIFTSSKELETSNSHVTQGVFNEDEETVFIESSLCRQRLQRQWKKIDFHLKNLQACLYDADLNDIVDDIEGTLDKLQQKIEDCKGIILPTPQKTSIKIPPNLKLKKQNKKY